MSIRVCLAGATDGLYFADYMRHANEKIALIVQKEIFHKKLLTKIIYINTVGNSIR
jgi:hypothetical protein